MASLLSLPTDIVAAIADMARAAPAMACVCKTLAAQLRVPERHEVVTIRSAPLEALAFLQSPLAARIASLHILLRDSGVPTFQLLDAASPLDNFRRVRHLRIRMGHTVFLPAVSFLNNIGEGAPLLETLDIRLVGCYRPVTMMFPDRPSFGKLTSLTVREEAECSDSDLAVVLGRPFRELKFLDICAHDSDAPTYFRDCFLQSLTYQVALDSLDTGRLKTARHWTYPHMCLRCPRESMRRIANQLAIASIQECWLEVEDHMVLSKVPLNCERLCIQLHWDSKLQIYCGALEQLKGVLYVWTHGLSCTTPPVIEVAHCGKVNVQVYSLLAAKLVAPNATVMLVP